MDKILHVILDEKQNQIGYILKTTIQEKDSMNALICSLVVSIQERRLHNAWQEQHNDERVPKFPPKKLVEQTVKTLNNSLNRTRFDQLLAIAESKVLIFQFLIWLQASKRVLTVNGIANKKQTRGTLTRWD